MFTSFTLVEIISKLSPCYSNSGMTEIIYTILCLMVGDKM